MLIGAGLFGLYTWVNPEEVVSEETIVVSEGRIEQFVSVYEKTWHRPPSKQELDGLIEDYVLEEIYYRQAVDWYRPRRHSYPSSDASEARISY